MWGERAMIKRGRQRGGVPINRGINSSKGAGVGSFDDVLEGATRTQVMA